MQPQPSRQSDRPRQPLSRQLLPSLAWLVLSTAFLYFQQFLPTLRVHPNVHPTVFLASALSLASMAFIFVYLQFIRPMLSGTEKPNFSPDSGWIRSATAAGVLAFIGFHIALGGAYSWMTPLVVIALFVQVFSAVSIFSAIAEEFDTDHTHVS